MFLKTFRESLGIFAKDRGELWAVDFAQPFVIAGLDAGVVDGGVHDVGLHEDHGGIVEAVGEEVASVEEGAGGDGADVAAAGRVDVGGEFGNFREGLGDGFPDERLLLMGALEELFQ